MLPSRIAALALAAAALALPGCATTPYTGPVEVTRFVAPAAGKLGRGTIAITFLEEMSNLSARNAFAEAVRAELTKAGYTVVPEGVPADQTAAIRTSRTPIVAAPVQRSGPVSVGVGGSAGSFGSGVGLGVGINLGGGREGPAANTTLELRIGMTGGETLWEGRAQMTTGVKSPYAQVATSARTLAAGLFKDFPGGNGETVTIAAKKLQGTK
ncbi:MAG: hypothetical protein NBV68_09060 [Erythrobacter sp.]|uniref:hypothetical protein n=1 Tax=Erythrobacter sp. TaxID=1042 RepID=UPI0025E3B99A|nr:hypothetical protein [Erythrobacter sp.]MCL9999518.1 hypothetical protein [Erythrobacter sp.]